MVRVGGMTYACAPDESIGNRISDMRLGTTGEVIENSKTYTVGGWASVNEGTEGPAIYDLMEDYITKKKVINLPETQAVRLVE